MNLEKLCKRGDPREIVSRPFGMVIRDINYAVATNGWAVAAVACDQIPGQLKKSADAILGVLTQEFSGKEINIDDLAAFCGPAFFVADCQKCAGTGAIQCDECDGEGEYDGDGVTYCYCEREKKSDAFIFGKAFNAHLVAQTLVASGISGKAMIGIANDTMLCIDGEGCLLRIMGLVRADQNARRFE